MSNQDITIPEEAGYCKIQEQVVIDLPQSANQFPIDAWLTPRFSSIDFCPITKQDRNNTNLL